MASKIPAISPGLRGTETSAMGYPAHSTLRPRLQAASAAMER